VAAHAARQILQQEQAGLVGPVQVVEHDHQRLRAGGAAQEARHALEEPQPFGVALERWGLRQVGEALADLGEQRGDLGGAVSELAQQLVVGPAADVAAQRLDEGEVG
jgi:type II secretory pathway component PulF